MKKLESLNLSRTKVTDDGIKIICESPLSTTLKQLTLISTGVTPAAAVHFKSNLFVEIALIGDVELDALQVLQLRGTVYAEKGIDKLQRKFHDNVAVSDWCRVIKRKPQQCGS
jgi:hypothetical protein